MPPVVYGCPEPFQALLVGSHVWLRERESPRRMDFGHTQMQQCLAAAERVLAIPRASPSIAAGDERDGRQVALVGSQPGQGFPRDGFGSKPCSPKSRPFAAASLHLPGTAPVGSSEHGAQGSHGPAPPRVGKAQGVNRHRDACGPKLPGATTVGRMEHHGAGRASQPELGTASGQGKKIHLGGHGAQAAK